MKYILVIDHIATGGAERILIDYYHHLQAQGHEPCIFVLSGYARQSEWTKGLKVFYGASGDEDNLLKKAMQQIGLYLKLKRLVKEVKPDILFSFLEKSNLLTVLVPTSAVKVVSVHNVLSIQYTKIHSNKVRRVLYAMIRWMYNRCQNVVAVSKQVKDDLIASFSVKEENIHVVNNYVDKEAIKQQAKAVVENFTFRTDVKYVMNIGRFSDQKAQWKLIKAFSLYLKTCTDKSAVHLILVGRGEYEDNLRKLSDDFGISDNVTILPFDPNPYKYMVHASLFVLSSIFEGFPIVLAEASSLHVPFVGARKAIPEEMFDNSEIWNSCVYDTSSLKCDFTMTIHDDERRLAELIKVGLCSQPFCNAILRSTSKWESKNDKATQFEMYDKSVKEF